MQAREANLLKFLQGIKQFIIPLYQRTYSWTTKECQQLWDDLERVTRNEKVPAHFVGSIVYIEHGIYQVSGVTQLLVIDGQQRLTTISLLLHALGNALKASDEPSPISQRKLYNYFLFNSDEEGELKYKLLLTRSDKDTYIHLIDKPTPPPNLSQRLMDNHRFFEKQIRNSTLTPYELYEGLAKFIIVDVSLDRQHDNPQLIFESLNSTGVDLTQADLIRNYILMGLPPKQQNYLYNTYWYQMEQSFGAGQYGRYFDRFMRDYLTIKNNGNIPVQREVYNEFKKHVESQKDTDIEETVADIYHYAQHFVTLAFARTKDLALKQSLQDIGVLRVEVAYPFLLEVYEDYTKELLTRDELLSILQLVESYVFRRAICGIPTNSLNKTFATLSREIDKERYLESTYAAFLLKDSYRRFPHDEEFCREFVIKDVYNFRSRNYLLAKLENYKRKEKITVGNYTIEHVLPQNQNLSAAWQEILGENWQSIQERFLHTIGNLTLTGYNPELSDRPFLEKRDIEGGFADSPLRLNHSLAHLETWGESEIQRRAQVLAQLAVNVWSIPSLSEEILASYGQSEDTDSSQEYSLETYDYPPTGELLDVYSELRKRILNLDASVREEYKKLYIAYKNTTNFVDIVPQKNRLRLSLNMRFDEIDDPKNMCRDVTNLGRWGNGDVEVGVDNLRQLDDVMFLIEQSFNKHSEEFEPA